MDDSAALRLTLRRCTAVLLVGLGLIAANTHPYGPSNGFGYPLAYLAVGYLALSLLAGFFRGGADAPDSAGGPLSGGGESDSGDGDDPGADGAGGADDSSPPPAAPVGGDHW